MAKKVKAKYRHKAVRLDPYDVWLDIVLCNNNWFLGKNLKKLYGGKRWHYTEEFQDGRCSVSEVTPNKGKFKNEQTRILMVLTFMDPQVICHEAVHVMFNVFNIVGDFPTHKVQEPAAYLTDFVFKEAMKIEKVKPLVKLI